MSKFYYHVQVVKRKISNYELVFRDPVTKNIIEKIEI